MKRKQEGAALASQQRPRHNSGACSAATPATFVCHPDGNLRPPAFATPHQHTSPQRSISEPPPPSPVSAHQEQQLRQQPSGPTAAGGVHNAQQQEVTMGCTGAAQALHVHLSVDLANQPAAEELTALYQQHLQLVVSQRSLQEGMLKLSQEVYSTAQQNSQLRAKLLALKDNHRRLQEEHAEALQQLQLVSYAGPFNIPQSVPTRPEEAQGGPATVHAAQTSPPVLHSQDLEAPTGGLGKDGLGPSSIEDTVMAGSQAVHALSRSASPRLQAPQAPASKPEPQPQVPQSDQQQHHSGRRPKQRMHGRSEAPPAQQGGPPQSLTRPDRAPSFQRFGLRSEGRKLSRLAVSSGWPPSGGVQRGSLGLAEELEQRKLVIEQVGRQLEAEALKEGQRVVSVLSPSPRLPAAATPSLLPSLEGEDWMWLPGTSTHAAGQQVQRAHGRQLEPVMAASQSISLPEANGVGSVVHTSAQYKSESGSLAASKAQTVAGSERQGFTKSLTGRTAQQAVHSPVPAVADVHASGIGSGMRTVPSFGGLDLISEAIEQMEQEDDAK